MASFGLLGNALGGGALSGGLAGDYGQQQQRGFQLAQMQQLAGRYNYTQVVHTGITSCYPISFREELQTETDEWLDGVVDG